MNMDNMNLMKQCAEYVYNNFNTLVYDAQYTYSQMAVNRCPLSQQNHNLYSHIQDLMEDFGLDNDLEEDWYDEIGIDVDDMFEELLKEFDKRYTIK